MDSQSLATFEVCCAVDGLACKLWFEWMPSLWFEHLTAARTAWLGGGALKRELVLGMLLATLDSWIWVISGSFLTTWVLTFEAHELNQSSFSAEVSRCFTSRPKFLKFFDFVNIRWSPSRPQAPFVFSLVKFQKKAEAPLVRDRNGMHLLLLWKYGLKISGVQA